MHFDKPLQKGQGLVEYALVLVLIAVVVIIVLASMGQKIQDVFCNVAIQLGAEMPHSADACGVHVAISNINPTVSGNITVEAAVKDRQGTEIHDAKSVEFYLDGVLVRTENTWHYCLGGGDASCNSYDTHALSNGAHSLRIIATAADGSMGESSVHFQVAN